MEERVKLLAKHSRECQQSVKTAVEQIAVMISHSISLSFKYNSLEIALKEGETQLFGRAAGESDRDHSQLHVNNSKIKVAKSVTPGLSSSTNCLFFK